MSALITRAQLARVASKATPRIVNAIVDHAGEVLPRRGLVTPLVLQHFMAQMLVESAYLQRLDEDLSYSAKRMCEVWPHRFPTLASAEPYAHRPEALAAAVYGGRMGNRTAAEAYANRGMGLMDTTGRNNRIALAAHMGVSVEVLQARLTSDAFMLDCAAATFVLCGCVPPAERDDVEGVTRALNGGLTDLAARKAALKLCRRVWTASAVISPAALIPKPDVQGETRMPESSIPRADALAFLARIASDPRTLDLLQRGLVGAEKGIAALPNSGPLSGYKTYILAGLGAVSTLATVAVAMHDAGGLTFTGYLAGITALVTCGGFATIRSAIAGNHAATTDTMLGIGQSIALQLGQATAAAPQAAADVVGTALDGVAAGLGSTLGGLVPGR